MKNFDVAIIGGGIVGLAHAWSAAQRNLKVAVFERDAQAQGASIRNFGMIWPIGQPAGDLYSIALQSREAWLQLAEKKVLEVETCGSLHVAHQPDEASLLQEFVALGTHQAEWLEPDAVHTKTDLANSHGLIGGMYSPTELRVDPRTASRRIAAWLGETMDVDFHFATSVVQVDEGQLTTSDRKQYAAERILICSGSDLNTLYPEHFSQSGLRLCKLQMLRTLPQTNMSPERNAHIASGLTLRHYSSFADCPSLATVRQRIQRESPELDRYGIHVMASLFPCGEVVLGDSHEYDADISPFDKQEIDELILRELKKVIRLENWSIKEKWHGFYAKHPEQPVFESKIDDHVTLFAGAGGAGMTMSFGLAENYWNSI